MTSSCLVSGKNYRASLPCICGRLKSTRSSKSNQKKPFLGKSSVSCLCILLLGELQAYLTTKSFGGMDRPGWKLKCTCQSLKPLPTSKMNTNVLSLLWEAQRKSWKNHCIQITHHELQKLLYHFKIALKKTRYAFLPFYPSTILLAVSDIISSKTEISFAGLSTIPSFLLHFLLKLFTAIIIAWTPPALLFCHSSSERRGNTQCFARQPAAALCGAYHSHRKRKSFLFDGQRGNPTKEFPARRRE